MRLRAICVLWLLPFLLTACVHKPHSSKSQHYAPPFSDLPKPEVLAVELPPSATIIPSLPLSSGAGSQLQQPRKARSRFRKLVNKNLQQAANAEPQPQVSAPQASTESPEVSAIGKLSSGDPSDLRRQAEDSITATERGLNSVGRTLSDSEQKTAAQIREFLKQARQALASGDVDGAHTLASKAKVLLSELAGT
jgi:ribosomal protein S20